MKWIILTLVLVGGAFVAYDALLAPPGLRMIFKAAEATEPAPEEPQPRSAQPGDEALPEIASPPPVPAEPVPESTSVGVPEPTARPVVAEPTGRFPTFQEVKPWLETYCFSCHGPGKDKGDFTFGDLADGQSGEHFLLLDKSLVSLRDESMPDDSAEAQPTAQERADMIRHLEDYLTGVIAARPPDPGRGMIRRLTRYEYSATVRDLFHGFPFNPARNFPDEDKMLGFDVIGQTQVIDQVLGEKYLAAADGVLNVILPVPGVKLSVALPEAEQKRIHDALFPVHPGPGVEPRAAAAQVIRRFASRAFRRPVEPERVERFLQVYDLAAAQKLDFETCVKVVLKAVLISPEFLLRVEIDPNEPGGPLAVPISDYELASRLSYFLWSSMPDDELFAAATRKELGKPEILEAQVRRMLLNPRARALAENFGNQWLTLDALDKARPSVKVFPEYDAELAASLKLEPLFFFASMIREDRSVLEMLDSDYAFVNARLARHYDLPPPEADGFHKISLPDKRRGGVLGMAAVLVATSYDTRTSVSHRGQWFLDRILGTPPPPAPMNVPPLGESRAGEPPKTLRERLEQHATEAACAGCHRKVDPPGFALENYDAIGRWRLTDAGKPLDTLGEFTDGSKVNGPDELKAFLIDKRRLFYENLARQTLTYALGRTVSFDDRPTILDIADKLEADPRFSTLILGVVNSVPFTCRRNIAHEP